MIKLKIFLVCMLICSTTLGNTFDTQDEVTEVVIDQSEGEDIITSSDEVDSSTIAGPMMQSIPSVEDFGFAKSEEVDVENESDVLVNEKVEILEEEDFSLTQSITTQTVATIEQTLELEEQVDEKSSKKVQVTARYLGILGQAGIDIRVLSQVSMGLYYGKFQGKFEGNDKSGVLPDLHHLNLQTTVYLNSEKRAFHTGGQLRIGVHANKQQVSDLVQSVEVDGKEVIKPGETKIGALLGVGYGWYGERFGINIGAEYLSLGALKSLIPLVISLGVTF